MRDASADYAKRTGKRPRVFLAKMGPLAQHKARADFTAGFFAPGGFEMVAKQTFATAAEAAQAAAESGAEIAVLCSTDETYPELVPAFASALKAAKPSVSLVLAGLPADKAVQDAFTSAGVEIFIHLRAPVEETLANLLKKIGAL
jgi:methylmalonyl-CoA mutase